jgi:hypothetical protein
MPLGTVSTHHFYSEETNLLFVHVCKDWSRQSSCQLSSYTLGSNWFKISFRLTFSCLKFLFCLSFCSPRQMSVCYALTSRQFFTHVLSHSMTNAMVLMLATSSGGKDNCKCIEYTTQYGKTTGGWSPNWSLYQEDNS